MLDKLFSELLDETLSQSESQDIESKIWDIWMDSGNTSIDLLMGQGVVAMSEGDFSGAIDIFSEIIRMDSAYSEGWNKRATAYYLRGNFKASLRDIDETLKREPRHFGAISGEISIRSSIGDSKGALDALRKLKQILPKQPGVDKEIRALERKLGIRRI